MEGKPLAELLSSFRKDVETVLLGKGESVALAGGLELDDRSGNRLREQDYDPAPYFGVRFVGGF